MIATYTKDVFDLCYMVDFHVNVLHKGTLDDALKELIPQELIPKVKAEYESWQSPAGSIYLRSHKAG